MSDTNGTAVDPIEAALDKLTQLQRRFVEEYTLSAVPSAVEAYLAAGGKGEEGSSARQQAARLMADDGVNAAIKLIRADRMRRLGVNGDWVVQRLVELVERCMQSTPMYGPNGEPIGEYKMEASSAAKALDLLGKHFGIFEKDNRQKGGGPTSLDAIKSKLLSRGIDVDKIGAGAN